MTKRSVPRPKTGSVQPKLPPRAVIAERVEAQRQRVWQAQAMCGVTSHAARSLQGLDSEAGRFAQDVWLALEGVVELLGEVAGKLEGDVVLDVRGDEGAPS